jgi:dipeptidyl aminopeptidase/acylaminoacyl peptidase
MRFHAMSVAILASSLLSFTTAAGAARPADPTLLAVSDAGKLTLVNAQTGRVRHFLRAYQATWSPDGKRIAFTGRGQGGPGDLFLIDADGRNLRRLTHSDDIEEHDPVWSSDGKRLAYFAQDQALSQDDLMVLSLATGMSATVVRGRPLKADWNGRPTAGNSHSSRAGPPGTVCRSSMRPAGKRSMLGSNRSIRFGPLTVRASRTSSLRAGEHNSWSRSEMDRARASFTAVRRTSGSETSPGRRTVTRSRFGTEPGV